MLSQEQIDFFHANGFLIMPGLIRGRELEMLQEAADSVVREGVERRGREHRYHTFPDGREVYWRSEEMWNRADIFKAVTVNPDLLENIGQCIGQAFYPWNDSLVVKLPDSGAPVHWHQDPPYRNPDRKTTYPVPNFTTDIYLDRSWPGNGCVYAIPGHHLVGNVKLNGKDEDALFDEYGAVPLELNAGDVLFHCLSTPHGSRANFSETTRRIFYVHYLAEEVYVDGYSHEEWASEKPGWNAEREAALAEMMRVREALGFESPYSRAALNPDSQGLKFRGKPVSPPRVWEQMSEMIPSEKRAAMKRLDKPGV